MQLLTNGKSRVSCRINRRVRIEGRFAVIGCHVSSQFINKWQYLGDGTRDITGDGLTSPVRLMQLTAPSAVELERLASPSATSVSHSARTQYTNSLQFYCPCGHMKARRGATRTCVPANPNNTPVIIGHTSDDVFPYCTA